MNFIGRLFLNPTVVRALVMVVVVVVEEIGRKVLKKGGK